jgi:hypothetical protein
VARHSLSTFSALWQRHERLYVELFSSALLGLATKEITLKHEDTISEALCVTLRHVCFEFLHTRNIEVKTPDWEGPIQPVEEDEMKGGKIRKRPDFTCKCFNRFASTAEDLEISMHVECKRLGNPTSATWILNEKYVKNGIKRFDSTTHEYGKRATSGLMIGYIIDMSPEAILSEVNEYQKKHLPDNSAIDFKFGAGNLFESRQTLTRKHVLPERFTLIHLWADLNKRMML